MPKVESSAIHRLSYDPRRRELRIVFRGTGAYRYFEVPQDVYDAFMAAASKGAFFNERIRDRYDFEHETRH